jgi:hypothetical protein
MKIMQMLENKSRQCKELESCINLKFDVRFFNERVMFKSGLHWINQQMYYSLRWG